MVNHRTKLKTLLRELFQFDAANLDFGIYRIMNQRRAEIEDFVERGLLDAVAQEFTLLQEGVVKEKREELNGLARQVRRMYVYNPIPSQLGVWLDTGQSWKNISLDRVVEDPFFKDSAQSYFVQLVDFSAYALLRRERPIPSKTKYGLDTAFNILSPILVREARRSDPEGIICP